MFNTILKFEQSGLSKSDFCARHRISQSQLQYWLKAYHSTLAEKEPAP
jgi:hypothetical protein